VIRIVEFLVTLMTLDARSQRAVGASLADWRHELKRTSVTGRTLLINVRSVAGVVRVLIGAGAAELRSASVTSFLWRLGAIVGLWVLWMLKDGPPGSTYRFFLVASSAKASMLVAAALIPKLLVVFPMMVFLAEAFGRRRRVTPVVGASVVLAGFVLLFGLLLPVSATLLRYETWRYFANASVAEPDVTPMLLSGVTILATIATLVSIAGVWLLFVFGNRVRRVGGLTGWGIGVGVLAVSYIASSGLLFVRFPILSIALRLASPFLSLAVLLWATKHLARIEAARSAYDARLANTV
jgi:hypothetical protein